MNTDDDVKVNEDVETIDDDDELLAEEENVNQDEAPTRTRPDVIRLPSGEAMTTEETGHMTAKTRVRLILLAGSHRSGKTTLLACLFLCFQNGPLGGYSFTGSRTLKGFERRCWLARTNSMGEKADTPRTEFEAEKYLHLEVRKGIQTSPVDLLFCDLPGEVFDRSVSSTEASTEIEELGRIDHLVILIDGNKLRRIDLRQSAQYDATVLLRSFIDSKALSPIVPIEFVFSKVDLFDMPVAENEAKDLYTSSHDSRLFVESVKDDIAREFGDLNLNVRFFETVARMEVEQHELGYGLDNLLPIWTEELRPPQAIIEKRKHESGHREIDLFCERELKSHE